MPDTSNPVKDFNRLVYRYNVNEWNNANAYRNAAPDSDAPSRVNSPPTKSSQNVNCNVFIINLICYRLNLYGGRSSGMRTLENSSSSEEEDRTDLLGRHFQVPRPKSRSNGSIAVSNDFLFVRTQ